MHQLNSLDSGCLFLESSKTPLQVGGLYIFIPSGKAKNFDSFKYHVAQRVTLEPIFRQRLSSVPLDLDHPYWIDDPNFNLDLHLSHIGLTEPAGHSSLMSIANAIYQTPLDRNRPLWQIVYIDGLDRIEGYPKGTFAVVIKIHHTLIHATLGERLFASLLDFTAKPRKIQTPDSWEPEPVPTTFEMLKNSYKDTFSSPLKISKLLLKTSQSAASSLAKRALANLNTKPTIDNTPASIFDASIDNCKAFYGQQFDLGPIKEIKGRLKETDINDVVLSICSGALRSYLSTLDKDAPQELIALLPIAVKESAPSDKASIISNTQVTGTLISLANQVEDPLVRLRTIKENYRGTKLYPKAVPARQLADYIPSIFMSMAAKLYTRWHYSEDHNPYFNLVINHIPGPQIPLYLDGARLVEHYHLTPIFDGLGLVINVSSYHGQLSFSIMTSDKIIPDVKRFLDHVEKSIIELLQAIQKTANETAEQTTANKSKRKTSRNKTANQKPSEPSKPARAPRKKPAAKSKGHQKTGSQP